MNIKKMLVASIAALSMIATSVVALAAEPKPTVTGTVVEGSDSISLKISLSNIEKECSTLTFKVKLPSGLQLYYGDGGGYFTLADYKAYDVDPSNSLKDYVNKNVESDQTGSGMAVKNVYKSATWNVAKAAEADTYFIALSAASGKAFKADNWLQFNFKGYNKYDALKATDAEAFKLSAVQIGYVGESVALTQANGEVAVVDPTTAVEPEPDPVVWTATAAGTDYTGEYDGSKAAAYTVELAGDGTTYNAITWKATKDGVTKGHVTALDQGLGGEGSFKFGIAIGGVATSELSDVQAAWGDQTPSSAE